MRWAHLPRLGLLLAFLLAARTALAERHVVQRGETLEHVARAYNCSVEAVLRANGLKTTLVPAGTVVQVPVCSLKARTQSRDRRSQAHQDSSDDDKARAALAVIDGAAWIDGSAASPASPGPTVEPSAWPGPPQLRAGHAVAPEIRTDHDDGSIGRPWAGRLSHGEHLDEGIGYEVRHPSRAYGAPHVIEHLRLVIAEVRALYPDVHTLAIGDLSAEHGGRISDHHSHQSGLDVDVGFYFTHVEDSYFERFAPADDQLDLEATWALLTAFARTADLDTGVEMIFLDRSVQARLYTWAKAHGTPADELAFLLQYPRDTNTGIVRHWPNHTNHMHVRFKAHR